MKNRIINPVDKECAVCKKMMQGVRRDRKYCSIVCTRKSSLSCGAEMKNIHGHQKYCNRECWLKDRYYKTCERVPGYKEKLNLESKERHRKVMLFLRNYKINSGCVDCGYCSHHAALQFDHVRGEKMINVCRAKSIDQAIREIEKCEVVCSNCHHVRSYERLENKII